MSQQNERVEQIREVARKAWHASGMKTISFQGYDTAYEDGCFDAWWNQMYPPAPEPPQEQRERLYVVCEDGYGYSEPMPKALAQEFAKWRNTGRNQGIAKRFTISPYDEPAP
jgi:hypothetical protein